MQCSCRNARFFLTGHAPERKRLFPLARYFKNDGDDATRDEKSSRYRELSRKRRCCERKEESRSEILFSYTENRWYSRFRDWCTEEFIISWWKNILFPDEIRYLQEGCFYPFKILCYTLPGRRQHEISVYLNWNATKVTRERVAGVSGREITGHERGRERVAYFTFCWRSRRTQLVLSYSRSVGKKYGGSEANGRTESGHKFCTFYTDAAMRLRLRRRSVRPVCGPKRSERAGHLSTRESTLICDSARFRPTSGYSSFSFSSYSFCFFNTCNNRNVILLLKNRIIFKIIYYDDSC